MASGYAVVKPPVRYVEGNHGSLGTGQYRTLRAGLPAEQKLPLSQPLFRLLVLTEHFVPAKGGSITWMLNTYSRFDPREVVVIAAPQEGDTRIDQVLPFRVVRIPMLMTDWDPTVPASLVRYLRIMWHVYRQCHTHHLQQIHCTKVFPEGLVAWMLRWCYGLPYLLYAHGEEILICADLAQAGLAPAENLPWSSSHYCQFTPYKDATTRHRG